MQDIAEFTEKDVKIDFVSVGKQIKRLNQQFGDF